MTKGAVVIKVNSRDITVETPEHELPNLVIDEAVLHL
jgi:hypothetical protein